MFLLAVATPRPARAQLGARAALPALAVAAKLAPGSWARYSVVNRRNGQGLIVHLAMLERAGRAQWFELAITDQQKRTLVVRSLIAGVDAAKKKPRVLASIIQPPGQRPLSLPASAVAKQRSPVASAASFRAAKRVGRETVKVPAGSFAAVHFRRGAGARQQDSWLVAKANGWPLVRYRAGPLLIELIARGKHAVSRIRGKALKLDERLLKQLGGAGGGVQK